MPRSDDDPKTGSEIGSGGADQTLSDRSAAVSAQPAGSKAAAARSGQSAPAAKGESQATDAIAMLKEDHRKVESLFTEFQTADAERKKEIIEDACQDLIIHTLLEERIFYPEALQPSTDDNLRKAQVEHDAAKVLIVELLEGGDGDEFRVAKFKVLADEIKHHITEEESPDGVFAKTQKAGANTRELAERLSSMKRQLQQRAESGRLPDPEPASFRYFGESEQQERRMPVERDEYGRFMSDDDRGYRSRSRDYDDDRGYRSRGRDYDDDRDYRSRGRDYDDDRDYRSRDRDYGDNRSRGAMRGGEMRHERAERASDDRRGYSEDAGQGGWFGDREGHAEASRRGWDSPDHGRSGWYGDREGHAEASRRGWDNPDHGPSGWYGNREGHAEASRRGWENSDHGRSGWYGDPEGHSEASRRGWEERGGGRSYARGRYERDYDDDRDNGRRGHGGWRGDPEGHSEAARRGWERRH